jgi:hypothetical protein
MRRALVLLLVILTALVVAGPTGADSGPRRGVYFELHTDGFMVQVNSNLGSGRVRLLLDRHGEVAYYGVRGQIGAGTVRARFGHLGSLDLRFTPGRGEGALGCGTGRGWQRGTFRGAIVFHGEHHYADVDAARARGWFQTYPRASCGRGGRGNRRGGHGGEGAGPVTAAATASRAIEVAETGVRIEGATSYSAPADYFYVFTENRSGGVRTAVNAFREERRGGMQIIRGAQVDGGASAFDWNLVAGTARLEPPAPFTGRAFFRREPGGPPRWWGSLRAPILGGKPMRLAGAQFHTRLGPAG